jgi:hypothetical protein
LPLLLWAISADAPFSIFYPNIVGDLHVLQKAYVNIFLLSWPSEVIAANFFPLLKGAEQNDKFFTLDANHTYISFRLYEDLHAVEFYGWHRSAAKQRLTSAVESALKPHLAKHELNKMEVLIEVLKSLAKAAKL